ncbi:MAG: T9SS type A sorting domain-containing protein, partial [Cytophagaceae bacterium]
AGTYVVVVDSGLVQHCIVSDTMVISASLIKPTLGSDKNLCIPAYYDFDAGSYAPSAVTYQWLKDGSIITGATAQTLTNVRAAGTYVVSVSSAGCTSVKDTVIVTSSLPVPTDGCGAIGTKVNLSVIGSGTYKWYGASTGTASYIQTGNAYLTPVLSSTTTYYVEDAAAVAGTAGPSTQFGSNYGRTPNADVRYNLWFNTGATPVNLDYVTVWAWFNATGTNYYINFRLLDNTNTVKQTVSVPVISTTCSSCWIQKRVPVGFTGIPAGVSGWKLDAAGSGGSPICDLNYASAGASYPYNSTPTGMLTITGQQDVTWEPNGYSFFYNWEISTGTPCSRLPVVATISSGCGAAPVELVRFNASEHNSNVVLVWQTASEAGNAYFTIERSLDNSRFENIGSVAGHGNSSVMLDYSFTDRYPPEGMSYYRLKQMDYNGHFTYSAVSAVSIKSAFTVNIYPVPVKESESLQGDFVLPAQQEIKIVCTDIYGQENFRFSLEGKEGKNSVTWPHRLRNGLYFLNITAGKETLVKKIMVQD